MTKEIKKQIEELEQSYEKAKDQLLRLNVSDEDAVHQNELFNSLKSMRDISTAFAEQLASYQINIAAEEVDVNGTIPWSILEQVSKKFDVDRLILFTANSSDQIQQIVTFGNSVYESHLAAEEGNYLKKFLDWPESQRTAVSGKVQEMFDAMILAKHELSGADRERSTAFKEIQRILIKHNQD